MLTYQPPASRSSEHSGGSYLGAVRAPGTHWGPPGSGWGVPPAGPGPGGRGFRTPLRAPLRIPLPRATRASWSTCRLWILITVISVYLLGVLLLSSVSFQTGPNGERTLHVPELSGFPYALAGGRRMPFPRGPLSSVLGGGGGGGPVGRSRGLQWCQPLRFLDNDRPRAVTALASFPGSGNTWLRYLLQQATGVHTGSVYKDFGLLKNGFPAESVSNGTVLAVKTHEWGPVARAPFHRAVLLVRSPGPAIQAEFNRQSGGHIGFAAPDRYRLKKGRFWANFVTAKLAAWRQTNIDWLTNFTGPTHIVLYDDLVRDVEGTLRAILDFLEHPVTDDAMACAIERREGIYRRKRRALAANFDPYTPSMKSMLRDQQDEVFAHVKKYQQLAVS
ncbi:WSCD family member AAEL009094 [Frankliniella occidentalis]|uniref:WSCD family member AAEL009094 n=1 Tax=Frankliniella occidentalis TaxID=133901 RepID=A0A9C6X550_FRAOC|nr:WSCD family member AAEL009094 [Frankliniella occidentalis]